MEAYLLEGIHWILGWLSLPEIGLPAIFVISLVSATLLPLGSEPVVFAYVSVSPAMFWPAVCVATVGNTVGGAISYWMGLGAQRAVAHWKAEHDQTDSRPRPDAPGGRWQALSRRWFEKVGPPALLLAWMPVIGDPLCAVAGYLRLPFWPCVAYMAIGKFLRYVIMTSLLVWGYTSFTS